MSVDAAPAVTEAREDLMTLSRNGPLLALLLLLRPAVASDTSLPPWLPRYDLEVDLDLDADTVRTRQQVTWTNRHRQPTRQLVFNAHAHYRVPDDQVGFMAKTLEVLRVPPGDALDSA